MGEKYLRIRNWSAIFNAAEESFPAAHHQVKLINKNYLLLESKIRSVCESMSILTSTIHECFQKGFDKLNQGYARSQLLCQQLVFDLEAGQITKDQFQLEMEKLMQLSFEINEPLIAIIDDQIEKYHNLRLLIEEIFSSSTENLIDLGKNRRSLTLAHDEGATNSFSHKDASYAEQVTVLKEVHEERNGIGKFTEFSRPGFTSRVQFGISRQAVADVCSLNSFLACPVYDESVKSVKSVKCSNDVRIRLKPMKKLEAVADYSATNQSNRNVYVNRGCKIESKLNEIVRPVENQSMQYINRNVFTSVNMDQDDRNVRSAGLFSICTSGVSVLAKEFD